jgi:hypothetical protein
VNVSPPLGAVACAVAAFDLPDPGAPGGVDLATVALNGQEWRELVGLISRSRLEGALAWSLATGAWAVDADREAEAFSLHRRAMALAVSLERDLLRTLTALDDEGISVRVLKGSALAHLDEPDPSRRAFGDVDLLVRGEDIEAVEQVLIRRGGQRRYAEPRPGFDRRFSKGASFTFDHNCEIDLHRTLAAGPFGLTIDLDELFHHTEPFRLGNRDVLALDRPSRFIHACYHAVLGSASPRISTLRDVVRTAPLDPAELRTVLDRADRWQAAAVVAAAVEVTTAQLAWSAPLELAAWTEHTAVSSRDRRWLSGYVGGRRSYAQQMIDGIGAVSGARDKVAYALAISLPAASAGRTPTAERIRRGVRALRPISR